jgi:hypothetical protein
LENHTTASHDARVNSLTLQRELLRLLAQYSPSAKLTLRCNRHA